MSSPSTPAPADSDGSAKSSRSHWLWVPSLYFAQGIPYVVVMTLSVVMYKRLGISNTDIAFYTSLLYLPWVLKPLWSPVVDMVKTKRQWILAMQLAVAAGLVATAMVVPMPNFFTLSLFCFWGMALMSSTHDIAADGFYMLGLSRHDQAWFVGIRSTFYRLAMIVGSGLLVMFAGYWEGRNGLDSLEVTVKTTETAAVASMPAMAVSIPKELTGPVRLVASSTNVLIRSGVGDGAQVDALAAEANAWNQAHDFYQQRVVLAPKSSEASFWSKHVTGPVGAAWTRGISEPLGDFLRRHFPVKKIERAKTMGNAGVLLFHLSRKPDHPITVHCAARPTGLARFGIGSADRGFKWVVGERVVFTPENWNRPCLMVIQADPRLEGGTRAVFETHAGNIPLAWSITLLTLAGVFLVFFVWHGWALPRPPQDGPVSAGGSALREFGVALGSFFQKPGILPALAFILLYRFAEAQSVKLLTPFLLEGRETGGLGLSTGQVGFAYGTIGVLMLTCGGLLGGFLAARHGLKKVLPVMVCAIHIPNLAFVYLSFVQPENFAIVNLCVGIEQFGYGFGFTAYMLYLLHFAEGSHKTAHYAIATGLMALGMMMPGFFAGWLQEILGYRQFFVWVMLATLPGFLVAFIIRVDPQFGRKNSTTSP